MTDRRLVDEKIYDHDITYIDPAICGSTVGFQIARTRYGYFDATVRLSDCDRSIKWSFSGNEQGSYKGNVAKIDKAISQLQYFREAYIARFKEHTDWRARSKKTRTRKVG